MRTLKPASGAPARPSSQSRRAAALSVAPNAVRTAMLRSSVPWTALRRTSISSSLRTNAASLRPVGMRTLWPVARRRNSTTASRSALGAPFVFSRICASWARACAASAWLSS